MFGCQWLSKILYIQLFFKGRDHCELSLIRMIILLLKYIQFSQVTAQVVLTYVIIVALSMFFYIKWIVVYVDELKSIEKKLSNN